MNEQTPNTTIETPARSRRNQRIVAGVFALLALIVAFGILASRAGLDKALLRQQLDQLATQLAENAKAKGREMIFTYGEIDVVGGFTDRHAVIHDPKLTVVDPRVENTEPSTIVTTTPTLEIYPRAADLSAMRVSMPDPITLHDKPTGSEEERKILTITSPTPLEIDYSEKKIDGLPYLQVGFDLPSDLKLNYLREQQAHGPEEETPTITPVYETLTLTQDKAKIQATVQRDNSAMGQSSMEVKNLKITSDDRPDEGALTVKQIVSQWSNQRDANNQNVVDSSFTIDDIEAPLEMLPYSPISMAMDMSYVGTIPGTPEETATMQPLDASFKLKNFSITTKDASLNMTADFVANAEDQLPVGMANISVTNLPFVMAELKKNQMVNEQSEQNIATLLKQITGTDYAALKDVTIDVKRARGGSFQIGKTTFEELFATILQGGFIRMGKVPAEPAPTPKLPADKQPAEPVELHEETRG